MTIFILTLLFVGGTAITGGNAAYLWRQSSLVEIPTTLIGVDAGFGGTITTISLGKLAEAYDKASQLNRQAAAWTASSVLLAAVAGLIGPIGSLSAAS